MTSLPAENLIGKGGYAEVYRGRLPDGRLVAVKKLTRGSPEEIAGNFLSELGIIIHTNHPNVAKLLGFGVDGGMHIVLQLSPHGSLASFLYSNSGTPFSLSLSLLVLSFSLYWFSLSNSSRLPEEESPKEKLGWGARYKVAVGTARGMEYLHERCQRRIIHRDIKAANILLSDDFEPQVQGPPLLPATPASG